MRRRKKGRRNVRDPIVALRVPYDSSPAPCTSATRLLANNRTTDSFPEEIRGQETVDEIWVKGLVIEILREQWCDLFDRGRYDQLMCQEWIDDKGKGHESPRLSK